MRDEIINKIELRKDRDSSSLVSIRVDERKHLVKVVRAHLVVPGAVHQGGHVVHSRMRHVVNAKHAAGLEGVVH